MFGELDRGFHGDVAIQIARVTGSHTFDAFAAQPELLACLRALRQIDGSLTRQGGHCDFTSECGGGDAHGHRAMQIVAIALEYIVFLEAYFNVQIAGGATIGAWLTVAGAADAHAVIDASGDFDFKGFLSFDLALAVAGGAGVADDFSLASAMRTGLLHAEKALAHLNHTLALASATGFG